MKRAHKYISAVAVRCLGCGLIALSILPARRVSAQTTNAPAAADFTAFNLITERNIFNPNRSARSAPRVERTVARPVTRADSFALVGTLSYDKGHFAFFDGTSADYRRVLQPSDTIAGFKVEAVTPNQVKLVAGTNTVSLPVGMQLLRAGEGEWTMTARVETDSPRPTTTTTRATPTAAVATREPQAIDPGVESPILLIEAQPEANATNTEPAAATEGDANDVLTKLRLRREQELNR